MPQTCMAFYMFQIAFTIPQMGNFVSSTLHTDSVKEPKFQNKILNLKIFTMPEA